MARCDDCGAEIHYVPAIGKWGERPERVGDVYKFTCRMFFDTEHCLMGVDYHHPHGASQQRFRISVKEEQ